MNIRHLFDSFIWSKREATLFLALFLGGLAARGLVLWQGFATDDYLLVSDSIFSSKQAFFAQGRPVAWIIYATINLIGANIVDCSFFFAISAIAIQSAFVVYAIRYVGLICFFASLLCGGIIVLHPYISEIYTFRIALPAYAFALLLVIAAIETARSGGLRYSTFMLVNIFISISLLVYQVAFNYILAVGLCGILASLLRQPDKTNELFPRISISSTMLLASLPTSGIVHVLILKGMRFFGLMNDQSPRSMLISGDQVTERIAEVLDVIQLQHIRSEPILHTPLKIVLLLIWSLALFFIFLRIRTIRGWIPSIILISLLTIIWSVSSVGIMIPFQEWYPAPRVMAHFSTLIGLTLLSSYNYAIPKSPYNPVRFGMYSASFFLIFSYILLGNQIFSDQLRLNKWDAMMANRILARLETFPNYNRVSTIALFGGAGRYERDLIASQGDINVSAFSRQFLIGSVLSESTGKKLVVSMKKHSVDHFCKAEWPAKESVFIDQNTAIVCLSSKRLP